MTDLTESNDTENKIIFRMIKRGPAHTVMEGRGEKQALLQHSIIIFILKTQSSSPHFI